MSLDLIFWLAVATFTWGASLVTYRWFAMINGWPMGEWQATRPSLPIAIGLVAIFFALLFAFARGNTTGFIVPMLGILLTLAWTAILRVGAQSALLLAPAATLLLVLSWITIAPDDRPRNERRSFEHWPMEGTKLVETRRTPDRA